MRYSQSPGSLHLCQLTARLQLGNRFYRGLRVGRPKRKTILYPDDMGKPFVPMDHIHDLKSKQLYLGTRYAALLTIILFLVRDDGGKDSCQVRPHIFLVYGRPLLSCSRRR